MVDELNQLMRYVQNLVHKSAYGKKRRIHLDSILRINGEKRFIKEF